MEEEEPGLVETIVLIDVPSEAGTHWPGQCKAPQALRDAGLMTKLADTTYYVLSMSALDQPERWIATDIVNGVRNEMATLKVIEKVAEVIMSKKASWGFNLVLGGDCSIEQGVVYGLTQRYPNEKIGIIYFDGDVDLSLPTTTPGTSGSTGILDSMVVTHLTQRAGGLESMKRYCKKGGLPLVTNENVVFYGFDPDQLQTEHWIFLLEGGFKAFSRANVVRHPAHTAEEAFNWLNERVDKIIVHFDVDVIDSGKFPLGNFPHYGGLDFDEVMTALKVFIRHDKVVALVVTEVNPNNDPTGEMMERLVGGIVDSLLV